MTTLALRYRKGYFVVSGPDTQPTRFRSRREAKDWEKHTASLGHPSMRSAPMHLSGWLGPHGRRMNQHDR